MKTNKLVLALAAATLAAGSAPLYADGDQPWHLTAQFGQMDLDSARKTEDDDSWLSVGFGRFFGDHFSLDVEYDEYAGTYTLYNTVVPGATYDKWSLSNWGLMGRYHFGTSAVRPYLALGAGWQKHGSVSDTDSNESLSYGLGLAGQFSKHFSGRVQALWRDDFDDQSGASDSYRDFILSIGISMDFGGKEPPPPPPPEPAPPPPPPPNPDLDGDGVLNQHDKCPNARPGAVVDLDG